MDFNRIYESQLLPLYHATEEVYDVQKAAERLYKERTGYKYNTHLYHFEGGNVFITFTSITAWQDVKRLLTPIAEELSKEFDLNFQAGTCQYGGCIVVSPKAFTESKLKEGGNLTVGDHTATKLRVKDMSTAQYDSFRHDFISFLYGVSEEFEKRYGYPIWEKPEELKTGRMFSGSTRALFLKDFNSYAAKKPKIGDFDVQVPEEIFEDFHKFILQEMPNFDIGDWTIYGCSKSPGQDHSLVQADKNYPNLDANYIQIDWEYVPFKDGLPTEFATFAHYSSWEDIENDIKGVFMKYLMRALVSTCDERENVLIVSEKTGKPREAMNKGQFQHFLGFSVDKGVRCKYKPYLDENGNQLILDGKECWCEAKTSESTYEQDIGAIFNLIFGFEPSAQDKKDMHSFVRTINHLMKEFDEERITKVFFMMAKIMWGAGAQGISAFDPEEDKQLKTTACNQFYKAFPFLKQHESEIEEMKATYYSNYKITQRKD